MSGAAPKPERPARSRNEELAWAEKMRRDFTANVSHEMKTPLQVISGYAELMANGLVPPEDVQKFAQLIYDESQAMRALIDDVLVLSRLDEVAPGSEEAADVDLAVLAEHVGQRLLKVAQDAEVQLRLDLEPVTVSGNETLLEQMVYNLVENAIRYNYPGGWVQVEVLPETIAEPSGESGVPWAGEVPDAGSPAQVERGGEVRAAEGRLVEEGFCSRMVSVPGEPKRARRMAIVRVSNTGPGIPPDKREKVFERFYRLEKSRSKETGGTGLGLAIVKHAALYHGGDVSVESEEDAGTRFTVRLPAKG